MGLFGPSSGFRQRQAVRDAAAQNAQIGSDADFYRQQLQRATYASLGPEFSQGLGQITNWASGAGPLADSGARTALAARLAGNIYGRATGQVEQGVSGLLGELIRRRREFDYQRQLMKQQHQYGQTGLGGVLGGIAGGIGGAILGGPVGSGIGSKIGSGIFGSGGGGGYSGNSLWNSNTGNWAQG